VSHLRFSFALMWALMLHAALLLFWLTARPSLPQGDPGAGLGVELALRPPPTASAPRAAPVPMPRTVEAAAATTVARTATPPADEQPAAPAPPTPRDGPEAEPEAEPAVAPVPDPVPRAPVTAGGVTGDRYLAQLRTHLAAHRRPVPVIGQARVHFVVQPDGSVTGLRADAERGEVASAAVALVQRALPLPRPPQGMPLELLVPLEFR
jgi:periplasmic protein TonB